MTGFYITISNGLLEGDHRKRMGAAVWEFLWCIDKVTKIDDNGDGHVLGGKPIQLDDLAHQMGVHRITVSEHLSLLQKEGYIEKTLHRHGISIVVKKTKKRFGKRLNQDSEKTKPRSEKTKPLNIDNTDDITVKTQDDSKRKAFKKPSLEEVKEYCLERKNNVDPERFLNYYESNGWKVGRNPMKDWRAAVRTWERNDTQRHSSDMKSKYGKIGITV